MPSLTLHPKIADSSRSSFKTPATIDSDIAIPATGRPLKISIVFDENVSARTAEILIRRVASGFDYDLQTFAFDELDPPGPGVAAARNASDTDILVVAMRDDRALPEHMQLWLGLCLGLRQHDLDGLLVVLIAKPAETSNPDKPLLDYLKTVAAIGGLEFISRQRRVRRISTSNDAPQFDGDFGVQA